ncbi:hypothetical protein [Herbaspirillum sp. RV1423]|uniref:hypothetical protein n=1 Tax=Herbaspirillum sp. RV1423 TaxID=1443993 RepID=UPI0004B9AA46|nr:hypothetical protein [Herbaspirillum sp. RV1423]
MKKICIVASIVLAGALACSAAVADSGTAYVSQAAAKGKTGAGKSIVGAIRDKKKFLYLDMVQRKRPDAIRNAVIVYEHMRPKKRACNPDDATSVSECLRSPAA